MVKKVKNTQNTQNTPAENQEQGWLWPTLRTIIRIPIDYPIPFFIGLLGITAGVYRFQAQSSSSANDNACLDRFDLMTQQNLKDAQLILIFENHNDQLNGTIPCVKAIDPVTAYFESVPLNTPVSCSSRLLNTVKKCLGWDDVTEQYIDDVTEHNKLKAIDVVRQVFHKYQQEKPTGKTFDQWLKTLFVKFETDKKNLEITHRFSKESLGFPPDYNKLTELDEYRFTVQVTEQLKFLQKKRKEGNDIMQSFHAFTKAYPVAPNYQSHLIEKEPSQADVLRRNKPLSQVIRTADCTEKTALIAGISHGYPYPFASKHNEARKIVWDAVDEKKQSGCKVAVLRSKDFHRMKQGG